MIERVGEQKVVVMHYTVSGEDGVVIETTHGREPLAYLHGQKNIVEGLERALEGHAMGETVKVTLSPEEAYGQRKGTGATAVPRKELLGALRDSHSQHGKVELRTGMPVRLADSAGNPVVVWVTRIQGSQAWIDVDHPLAGRTLTFECEILFIRDPYPEEIDHGHAHY
jgi:FKBP-type peptidyl-prolyl cis-trans isomerase SlyD